MDRALKILHIEDIASDAKLVDRALSKSGIVFKKVLVDTREEYINALKEFDPDVILSDHSLPAFNSLEALTILKKTGKDIPFILITSTVSEEFAVSVMKEGAADYVLKDRLQRLPNALLNALDKIQTDAERQDFLNKIVANEALFSKAESIAEFGTWRVDINSKIINWSAGTYPLLGYTVNEVSPTFKNFLENIHPDDIGDVRSIFSNTNNNASFGEVEFRVINKDRSIRYVRSQFELEVNDVGAPVFIIGFNQDVTRSKLAQLEIENHVEELKAASDRQSALLNALPPYIVLLNEACKIIAVNESWKKITLANNLGLPKYGIDYSYVAVARSAMAFDETAEKKIAKGARDVIAGIIDNFSIEYCARFPLKKIWFQVIVAPLSDKTKKGAVVLHTDITERKQAEELMLQSKANLNTIFENTDVAYVLCNTEQKIVSFNSKANDLSIEQFNKKLRIGTDAFNYFQKSKIPNARKVIDKVLNNEIVSYETSYKLKDNSLKWYDVKWVGVADEQQTNIGFILAFKDITERKISDIERDRITSDLVQRNTDLEQFTYIVSHNLRAPVANIIGLSNMLNTVDFDVNETDQVKSALTTSINVLDQIIMDINHILQTRSQVDDKTEVVSLPILVEDIKLSLNNVIKNDKVTIEVDFKLVKKIVSVKSYLYSIFYNLILNSIKFRKPGMDAEILISAVKNENNLLILFRDNGKGIEERNLKNIFGLYKRFDTSVEGKGMGLFMVKMHVEALGGKISVKSQLGSGTTLTLEFPDMKYVD